MVYEVQNISEVYSEYITMTDYKTKKAEYYNCKYCGTNNKKKFRSKAHLIPEFTGNKEWFCYDECDDCNHIFGNYYENALKNFGAFKNSFLPIKGKKPYPKYVDGHKKFSIKYRNDNTLVMNTSEIGNFFDIENNNIKVSSVTPPFIPLYVYKCLFKFGLALMNTNDFHKFKSGIPWLLNKDMKIKGNIPHIMLLNSQAKPVIKPIAILLKRKKEYNSPEYSLVFQWGFYFFQIFLPFNSLDENLDYNELKFPVFENFVTKNNQGDFGLSYYDMDNLNKVKSIYDANFGLKNLKRINSADGFN